MAGIVTQFVLLDRIIERMSASGDAAQGQIATALQAEPAYAYLGAVGPDLVDFMPNDLTPGQLGPPGKGPSPFTQFWQVIHTLANGSSTAPSLVKTLATLEDFLNKLSTIARNEDIDALQAFSDDGQSDAAIAAMNDLATIVGNIVNMAGALRTSIVTGQKPFGPTFDIGQPVPPPIAWECRMFLYWKRTGDFVTQLVQTARESGDPRFIAYAYGYAISYTGKVCGNPFLNSIVGSSFRLNWWRHRWINLFGDAWVWGFYNTTPRPQGPDFDYASMPNLCNANLQKKIELPGIDPAALLDIVTNPQNPFQGFPDILPNDFRQFWFTAFERTYGPPPDGSRFAPDRLNGAYLLTWLMLWFQTSGEVLGCNPVPPLAPPDDDCGTAPPWVDPATAPPGSGGTPELPPPPKPESDPSVGEIVCGALLALLGLAELFTGDLIEGGKSIKTGIALILDGATEVDWANLRCQLYWYHVYLYNGLNALHQAAELIGVVHPYAAELATDSTVLTLQGIQFTFDSGSRIVQSRGKVRAFPAGLWDGSGLVGWTVDPTVATELPSTVPYLTVAYPSFWIDDAAANPLSNGRVREGGPWPVKMAPGGDFPVQFGNAVDNAIDVLLNATEPLPDWNLDGDRGLAYFTWQFQGNYTSPVQIEQET